MAEDVLLLDTDIVSLFGRTGAPPGLRPWLLKVGIGRLAISYPTITELMRGAHLLRKSDPERSDRITAWVKRILGTHFPAPEMSAQVAEIYAHMTSIPSLRDMWTVQRDQKSNRLGHDLMIAAVAITHRLPIVTANVQDFRKINASFRLPGVYHPMAERWYVDPTIPLTLPELDRSAAEPSHSLLPTIGDDRMLKGFVYDKTRFSKIRSPRPGQPVYTSRPRVSAVDIRNRN